MIATLIIVHGKQEVKRVNIPRVLVHHEISLHADSKNLDTRFLRAYTIHHLAYCWSYAMKVVLPFTERIRRYGYVYWTKEKDNDMRSLLDELDEVLVWFQESYLGRKKIVWKYRRISLGWAKTRALPSSVTELELHRRKDGSIRVTYKEPAVDAM